MFISSLSFAVQMTEQEFTRNFVEKAGQTFEHLQLQIIQPLQVRSIDASGYEFAIFLDNAYGQYTSNPEELDSIIASHIRSIGSGKELFSSNTNTSILAVIKPADYLATVKRQLAESGLADKDIPLVFEKINEDLYIFFVFDTERGMTMLTKQDLTLHKLEERSLRAIATRNLTAYFEKNNVNIRRLQDTGSAKVYSVSLDDNYEASILLLEEYWNKEHFDVAGSIVAFAPARNVVIVTGALDAEGMSIASYLGSAGFKELGYAISPNGYTYDGGSWKPLAR